MKFQQETADSCSKPDGTEEVKEIIESAMNTEAAGMIRIPGRSNAGARREGYD